MTKVNELAQKATDAQTEAKQKISELQKQLDRFEKVNALIKKRDIFTTKQEEVNSYLSDAQIEPDFFEKKTFSFRLYDGDYDRNLIFKISNESIIRKGVSFFSELFKVEIEKLDNQILELMK